MSVSKNYSPRSKRRKKKSEITGRREKERQESTTLRARRIKLTKILRKSTMRKMQLKIKQSI